MTTYIHNLTLAEFTPVTVGPKVIVLKCTKAGIKMLPKEGDITRTSPAGLMVLYSEKK